MQLTLTNEEVVVLRDALLSYVSDLRMEIGGTDSKEYRDRLKAEETFLRALIGRLGEPGSAAETPNG
jgi:hypothetical protein